MKPKRPPLSSEFTHLACSVLDTLAQAVEHGDEHVIKFADTAADVYTRTGNTGALAAAVRATRLIDR
jgi:hypothetical protein